MPIHTELGNQPHALTSALFQQEEWWVDHEGNPKKLDDMPGKYLLNVALMMERCADSIYYECHGYDAFEAAAKLWLYDQPLYQNIKSRLVGLIEKGEGR